MRNIDDREEKNKKKIVIIVIHEQLPTKTQLLVPITYNFTRPYSLALTFWYKEQQQSVAKVY